MISSLLSETASQFASFIDSGVVENQKIAKKSRKSKDKKKKVKVKKSASLENILDKATSDASAVDQKAGKKDCTDQAGKFDLSTLSIKVSV